MPDTLMMPLLKSKKLAEIPHSELDNRAIGALKATPRTNATVRLAVRMKQPYQSPTYLDPQTNNRCKLRIVDRNRGFQAD